MPRTPRELPPLPGPRAGLVWPVRVDPTGEQGPTRGESAGQFWRPCGNGLYLPTTVSTEPVDQRIVEAAAHLPVHGFLTGWAALRWHGATWFDGFDVRGNPHDIWVDVWLGGMRPRPGIRVTEESLGHDWIVQLDGIRTVTPAWAAIAEMRFTRSLAGAVAAFDMAAYSDLVDLDEMNRLIDLLPARTGIPRARIAAGLADENSWSPQETRTRVFWEVEAGLPRPLTNRPIFADGMHLGTPDLVVAERGLVIEYDSKIHIKRGRQVRDVHREELFRDHGLDILVVQGPDFDIPSALVSRMVRAYENARRPRRQTWTLDPPDWWADTHTVALRRSLPESRRDRLLAYRRTEENLPPSG